MKRQFMSVACATVLVTGAAAAQERSSAASGQQPDRNHVTVTGCLSVNPAARTYILTTKPDNLAQSGGAVANAPTTVQYQLFGGKGLEKLVGNTVEVTGQIRPETAATAKSESKTSATAPNGQKTDKTPKVETKTETKIRAQAMRVDSFRSVSGQCEPTKQ